MRRRELIALLPGAAAAAPLSRVQAQSTPVIGFLHSSTFESRRDILLGFHRGLAEMGYVEGRNLVIEYRSAEDHSDRLPELAADLVARQMAVIVSGSTASTIAAKAATQTIPIVFLIAASPVEIGLVASLAAPGRNVTGVTNLLVELTSKRLELLHELVPAAKSFALLVNPNSPILAEADIREAEQAAKVLSVDLSIFKAGDTSAIEAAFSAIASRRVEAVATTGNDFFLTERSRVAALAARYAVPAIYAFRESAVAGGLTSYGTDVVEAYRQVGLYTGRILKGERPSDLPVQQATRIQLVINMKAAKALGLAVPRSILLRADEVIE
jgi:ABC-type uncharacterized transport system substrate-binding protein